MNKLLLLGAMCVLLGAGCVPDISQNLNRTLTGLNPFDSKSVSRAHRLEVTRSIEFADGLNLTIRPTYLGVTGSIADVLGDENGRMQARLNLSDGEVLEWSRTDRRETASSIELRAAHSAEGTDTAPPAKVFELITTSGHLAFEKNEDDRKMLLPAFWPEGESRIGKNGILWLPKDAHSRLKQGQKVEWNLGLGNSLLDTASDILSRFNTTALKLFGDENAEKGSPFDLELVTEDGLFAVRINGKIETVEVIQAKSWFANYLILDHPENPLILKVSVNPVAIGALDAFSTLGVDTDALGYEITEIAILK